LGPADVRFTSESGHCRELCKADEISDKRKHATEMFFPHFIGDVRSRESHHQLINGTGGPSSFGGINLNCDQSDIEVPRTAKGAILSCDQ
jgi:hypothetical protein